MSMGYYINKIPHEFVGLVHYSMSGYYYGKTKIADYFDSTETIRAKARAHQKKLDVTHQRNRAHVQADEKKKLLETELKNVRSNNVLLEEEKKKAQASINGLNQSPLFEKQRKQIEQKYQQALKNVEKIVQETEAKIRANIIEVEELKKKALASDDYDELERINSRLRSIGIPKREASFRELSEVRNICERVSSVMDTLENTLTKLKKFDRNISELYIQRVEKIIENLNPFDSSFDKTEKEIESTVAQIINELKELSLKQEFQDETEAILDAIEKLEAAQSSFIAVKNVDHETNYQTYRPSIDETIEEFDKINSAEILEELNRINEEIARLDMNTKTRESYERLIELHNDLVELKDKNRLYNDKKNVFDATLNRINKQISELSNREIVDMTFDINHYEEQMKELEKIEAQNIVDMKNMYFRNSVTDVIARYEEKGMIHIAKEFVLENSDNPNEEKYAKMVFMDKEHPEVVTVVYVLKTGEQFSKTMPAVYQLNGKYYFAEDSEELRKLISKTCKKTINESMEEVEITDEDMEHYVFSEAVSKEINQYFHLVDEKQQASHSPSGTRVKENSKELIRATNDKQRMLTIKDNNKK